MSNKKKNVDIDNEESNFNGKLTSVIFWRDINKLKEILDDNKKANTIFSQMSALSTAIHCDWDDGVKMLIKYGTSMEDNGFLFGSALSEAVYSNASKSVRVLLDNGANTNVMMNNQTLTQFATEQYRKQCAEALEEVERKTSSSKDIAYTLYEIERKHKRQEEYGNVEVLHADK